MANISLGGFIAFPAGKITRHLYKVILMLGPYQGAPKILLLIAISP